VTAKLAGNETILNAKRHRKINSEETAMSENNVLVSITASREKDEIVYRVECASNLTEEKFEYYLSEIIKGLCKWKKTVCEDSIRNFSGKIKAKKK